jgi:hypothetical protein
MFALYPAAMGNDDQSNQRYPFAFWAYIALLVLFFVDATLFASTTVSVKPANAIILGLLIFGLLTGSRACRWILIALSLMSALGILLIQAGSGNFGDALLVIIPLGQAGALFSPSMRAFTAARARRPI